MTQAHCRQPYSIEHPVDGRYLHRKSRASLVSSRYGHYTAVVTVCSQPIAGYHLS